MYKIAKTPRTGCFNYVYFTVYKLYFNFLENEVLFRAGIKQQPVLAANLLVPRSSRTPHNK